MQLELFTKYVIISEDSNNCKIFIYFPLYVHWCCQEFIVSSKSKSNNKIFMGNFRNVLFCRRQRVENVLKCLVHVLCNIMFIAIFRCLSVNKLVCKCNFVFCGKNRKKFKKASKNFHKSFGLYKKESSPDVLELKIS